jgi:hypothetical protein
MEKMKEQVGDSDPELLDLITNPVNKWQAQRIRDNENMWERMIYRPEPFDVPQSLHNFIAKQYYGSDQGDSVMFELDLNADGQSEYLLINLQGNGIARAQFFYLADSEWKTGALNHHGWRFGGKDLMKLIKEGEIEIVDPRFKHVEIGGVLLQPSTSN